MLGNEEIKRGLIVGGAVYREAIALARCLHQRIKRRQIGRTGLAHLDPFALGQPNIIAPLAFHAIQDSRFRAGNVEHRRAARLDSLRTGLKAIAGQQGAVGRRVGQFRLDLENRRAFVPAFGCQRGEQSLGLVAVMPISKGTLRGIGDRQATGQVGCALVKKQGTGLDGARRILADYATLAPFKATFQVPPTAGLQDMGSRMGRDKGIPSAIIN